MICTPDVLEIPLKDEDKIIVLASDGVWELLSNEAVMDLVGRYYASSNAEDACERLVEAATNAWSKQGSVIDDITAIVIFLT